MNVNNDILRPHRKSKYKIMNNISLQYQDICFIVLIIISLSVKLWKSKYGISEYDEAFYLTIPHRMALGDSLFFNEWHPSQMTGFLLYPIFCFYMSVFRTTEGIQLAFRYVYIAFHLFVVVFVYCKIRKNGLLTVLGCVLFFLFSPFQLMALSYNTFGMDYLLLSGVLLASYQSKKKIKVISLLFAGLFFAASVICCPYLVIAYFIYAFSVIIIAVLKRKKHLVSTALQNNVFTIRSLISFSIGCILLAIGVFVYIFTHMSITSFLDNMKFILNDPEHLPVSVFEKFFGYFRSIFISDSIIYKLSLLIYVSALIVMLFYKKRRKHKTLFLSIACVFTIVFLLFSLKIQFNAFIIPISFLGLFAFVLSNEKNWNVFIFVYLLGIIYSFALNCSSNTGIYAIGLAFAIPSLCSFIFINEVVREMLIEIKEKGIDLYKAFVVFVSFTILCYSSVEIVDTVNSTLWDGKVIYPHELTEKIESGPLKGVMTTSQRKKSYENIYSDLEYIKLKEHKPILCLSNQAWIYLALETYEYATFSAWLPETDITLKRLDEYYLAHPNKKPNYIFIPDTGRWEEIEKSVKYYEAKGYISEKFKSGYFLELA